MFTEEEFVKMKTEEARRKAEAEFRKRSPYIAYLTIMADVRQKAALTRNETFACQALWTLLNSAGFDIFRGRGKGCMARPEDVGPATAFLNDLYEVIMKYGKENGLRFDGTDKPGNHKKLDGGSRNG